VGIGWSGENSDSMEEDVMLLLASAASMAPLYLLHLEKRLNFVIFFG